MLKTYVKQGFISIILLFAILSPGYSAQELPQLADITHIEIRSNELHSLIINKPEKRLEIVAFFNQYQNNWATPLDTLPATDLIFTFYSEQGTVSEIGISNTGISRNYGNFWTQEIDKTIIKQFAGSIHPAIEETLFPIIPLKHNEKNTFNYWRQKLDTLKQGAPHQRVIAFIKEHGFRIIKVNNHQPEDGYWIKIILSLVNDGEYVDTVLTAKLILNEDHSLKETQFLGYQLSKKPNPHKIITTSINTSTY